MYDDLRSATSLDKYYQDVESITRLAKPLWLSATEQMARAMEPLLSQQEIRRLMESADEKKRLLGINIASQYAQSIAMSVTASGRIAESLVSAQQTWLKHSESLQRWEAYHPHMMLHDVSLQLSATERLMAGINFDVIGSHYQNVSGLSKLEAAVVRTAASYTSFVESIEDVSGIIQLPTYVLQGATRELYTTGFALGTLCPWGESEENNGAEKIRPEAEVEDDVSICIGLLRKLDPKLIRPYVGARDALNSSNTDKARHILTSLRELWGHLLRHLAPDNLVEAWISEVGSSQRDLLQAGKPTRQARIRYVCRELNSDPFTEFLVHDTRAFVKMIELFNRVHQLEMELTDDQLKALLLRTDSWLTYILQISEGAPRLGS